MKPKSTIQVPLFYRDADRRSLITVLAVSFAVHVALIFLAVFLISEKGGYKRSFPSVINVTMVSLPSQSSQGPAISSPVQSAPQKVETPPQKKVPAPVPVQEKVPSPPPKPEAVSITKKTADVAPKTSLKKKTYKPAKAVESAIKRIQAKAESTRSDSVAQALHRLKKDVEKGPPNVTAGSALSDGSVGSGSGLPTGGQGGSLLGPLDLYKMEISYQIQKNWAFPEQLAGNVQNAETVLVITIAPSGQIQDIWFEKKSGNSYLDESAYRAVKKSNPLPPFPQNLKASSYDLGLMFTPSGLKK